MYSNINETMLKKYFKKEALLAGFSETSILYIFSLIEVNMQHSYFHKPNGIHKTQSGLASKGSYVSLRGSELETFEKLDQNNVLESVDLDNRFRDDIFSHINGDYASIRKASFLFIKV